MATLLVLCICLSLSLAQAVLTGSCCTSLKETLKDKVSFPESTAYESSVQSYWSLQEQQVAPSCVVLPASTEDVSTIVKALTAADHSCKFAIRSGGHTAFAGSANIEGGVTVDMSGFKDIILSPDHTQVTLGSGQRWGNVYASLEPLGLAVTGGRVCEAGVGGLILGGGISFFAPSQGFSCDNVLAYEIVLANGSVVTATSTSHSDLWLALKGGSNNFGIVTRVVMRTFRQGAIYAGSIFNPVSTAKQQFDVFSNFISDPHYDENSSILHNWGFDSTNGPLFVNQILYSKPVANASTFQSLRAIQPQLGSTSAITTLPLYSVVFNALSPANLQELVFGTSFANDVATIQKMFDLWNASTYEIASVVGVKWSMSLQPINNAIVSKSASAGGNSFGLTPDLPNGALILASLSATWNNSDDSNQVENVANKLLHDMIATSKAQGTFNRYLDLNHANKNQNPIVGYGSQVHAQLIVVSRRYDPRGVFQKLVPGGFKLW